MSPLSLRLLVICHHQSAFLISVKPLAGLYQQLEGWLAGLALPEHHLQAAHEATTRPSRRPQQP